MYSLTSGGMRYMDEYTIKAGIPSAVLMENAAKAALDELVKRFPDKNTKILVCAGPGNNGGDAVCLARWLLHKGYEAKLYFVGDSFKMSTEFKRQISVFSNAFPNEKIHTSAGAVDTEVLYATYDVIVDGLFGIGLNRELDETHSRYIEYLDSKKAFKLAIDIPSGLNADTGESMGAIINADLTVTFGAYKNGMFLGEGRKACGEVVLADIGILESGFSHIKDKLQVCDTDFFEGSINSVLAPRVEQSHKGSYGTVGIVVSSEGMLGASILAAKAAYRAGCGLVKLFCPAKYLGFFNVSIPEAVVVPYKNDDVIGALNTFIESVQCVLIGPGLKESATERIIVKQILASNAKVVFDAGAINLISKSLKSFKKRKCRCVITPHIGELARLVDADIRVVERERVAYTKAFSEKFDVSMVAKSDTQIFALRGANGRNRLCIGTAGNSGLATAGSGDVQAGIIASLIAQGNSLNASLLYGSYIHARASQRFAVDQDSKRKMMAGDIIDNLF